MRESAFRRLMHKQVQLMVVIVAVGLGSSGCVQTERREQGGMRELSPKDEAKLEQRVEALAHFATGISAELNRRPAEATEEFRQAALADMQEEGLVLEAARRLIREEKNKEAVELLQKVVLQPNPPESTYALLGLAYLQGGETNLAIRANQKSVKVAPDNLAGYQNLAGLQLLMGKTNEAVAVLEKAFKRTNASPEFLLGSVDLLVRFNRQQLFSDADTKKKMIQLLDAAVAQPTENPMIAQRIADLYLLHGEPQKAEPIFADLLKRYPNNPVLRQRLANIYLRTDKNEQAARLLEEMKKDNPTDPSTYFFLGSIAYEAKEYDKAAESFETALKLNPEFEPLYYDLAGVHLARQQPIEALGLLERAKGKFKLNFIQEFYSGLAQSMMENWTEAISHLTSAELIAKTTEPNRLNHIFYYQLGSVYERSGSISQAVAALKKSLSLSPNYAEALNYLGYMWAERGENLEEAHSMLQRAVELEPENAAILDSLAWVLFKMGKPEDALVPMNKAIALTTEEDATLFDHLGDIEAAMKSFEKAREAYTRSLAVKADEKVKQKLDSLRSRSAE